MTKETRRRLDKWVGKKYEWIRGEIGRNIAKGQMNQYTDDLTIHMIQTVYTQNEDKIIQMLDEGKLEWWLLTGASMQLRSSTSPFYRTYRQHKSWAREDGYEGSFVSIFDRPDEPYDDSLYECFQEQWANLHFYQKAIMEKYFFEEWPLQKIFEYYNISKRHLVKDINTTINQIRKACQHC